MFCPVCHAEYREGFWRCADCEVELVSTLSGETRQEPEHAQAEERGWALLTREDDPVFLSALVSALEEGGIQHLETPLEDFRSSPSVPFPGSLEVGRGYEVHVPETDLETAKNTLDGLERGPVGENEGPVAEQAPSQEPDAGGEISEYWGPNCATSEVWAGSDAELARFLQDTVRENGVGCRVASDSELRLLVRPEDTGRAREIVREVLEGTPPA
jgi:hypothetical protein